MNDGIRTQTLAELYLNQGHPQRAIRILENLLAESPGDERVLALIEKARKLAEAQGGEKESAEVEETREEFETARRKPGPSTPEKNITGIVIHLHRLLERIRERRRQ